MRAVKKKGWKRSDGDDDVYEVKIIERDIILHALGDGRSRMESTERP